MTFVDNMKQYTQIQCMDLLTIYAGMKSSVTECRHPPWGMTAACYQIIHISTRDEDGFWICRDVVMTVRDHDNNQ